jgi:hypothetical protein
MPARDQKKERKETEIETGNQVHTRYSPKKERKRVSRDRHHARDQVK